MCHRSLLAVAIVLFVSAPVLAEETKEVEVGAIKLKTPVSWKQSEPTSSFRVAQFEIPAAEGAKEPAELAIFQFQGGGGGVAANVQRWVGQFSADGRKAKITKGKGGLGEYVVVEVTGTYNKSVGPPVLGKTEPVPNAMMLGVILHVEGQSDYFFKLTGGKQTVSGAAEAFRASFGGKAADEKPLELE